MLFTADVIVLTTHTESNKKEHILKIAHGIITWISVLHEVGSNHMVSLVLLHHEHQIAPSTEGMVITGDGHPIEWTEYYESYQPPYELKIKAWAEDTTHPHTVHIRIAVLPRKAIISLAVIDAIKSIFGMLQPKRIFTAISGGNK